MKPGLAVLLACTLLARPALAAQPQFWTLEGAKDFLDGDTDGLSVDSEGRLRLAPQGRTIGDPATPYVWSLARGKDAVFAGTGNEGRVFRVAGGEAKLLWDAPELEVHALAVGPDGRLYAGTSPDGKVYAIDASGKAETFYDPKDRYIWALAFDGAGNLVVATGSEGKVVRLDPQGHAQVLLTTPETHITALAVASDGTVYAGSAPGGVLYRIDRAGKVFVIYDSAFREVRALDLGADGSLWAALVEAKDKDDSARPAPAQGAPAPAASPAAAQPTAEVTVTETVTAIASTSAAPIVLASPIPLRAGAKGAVLRVAPTGEVDMVWTSPEDMPQSLLALGNGVLVGTGNKGKVYEIRADRTWTMLTALAAEQITHLLRGADGAVTVASSNPGRVYELSAHPGAKGTFTSKVKDTDAVSTWGRVRWEAATPAGTAVTVQSRSGNTGSPDSTWSDWSPVYASADGQPVVSPAARFLQLRAVLTGGAGTTAVLDSVIAAYLQRNLRPDVTSITVHPAGEVFQKPLSVTGEIELMGVEASTPGLNTPPPGSPAAASASRMMMPSPMTYARRMYQRGMQTFSWKAEDPNGDTLVYDVEYKAVGDARFRPLRKAVTDPVITWDTNTVPNGRYLIRVTASDSPGNPRGLALTSTEESAPFDVDNTPPVVTLTAAAGGHVRVVARDDASVLRKAEYSVDGGKWQEVYPTDGINDAREETYEIAPEKDGDGPHVLVVRASDLLGNTGSARLVVP